MPLIKGSLGNKVIAEENISQGDFKKNRKSNDPIHNIHIDCKIPQNIKYNVGSMDVFNFEEELKKIQIIKYADVLKI